MADDIARGGVKAQLRCGGGPVAGERYRLAQPIPFRRQPGGREGSDLPLDQGAVIGDGSKGRCDVCTVHQQSGVLQTAALQEADRDKLAPAQIHQSGICLLHKLRLLLGLEGTVQEGHCLGSGAGGLWCEAGLGDAPCHAFFPGPAHRIVVIAVRWHIGEDAVPLLYSRVSGKGVKEAYHLPPVQNPVRSKLPAAYALSDAGLCGPKDCVSIINPLGHVGEGATLRLRLGGTHRPPENRDHLGPGAVSGRTEDRCGDSCHNTVFQGPVNGGMGPVPLWGHIGELAAGTGGFLRKGFRQGCTQQRGGQQNRQNPFDGMLHCNPPFHPAPEYLRQWFANANSY